MEIKAQSKLKFISSEVINVVFNAYARFNNNNEVDIDINPKVFLPKNKPDEFKIVFSVSLKSEGFFELLVTMVGAFKLEDVADENKTSFINLNAPAIMFPYVRSFITTFTSNCGSINTIIIPAHFFKGTLEEISLSNMGLQDSD